jgi:dTDP-4-dehydrorhamnose reductase
MKVVIFGSNGMLGSYLKAYLGKKYKLLALTRGDVDLSTINEYELLQFMYDNITKDDVIINTSGVIKKDRPDIFKINSLFPHILAKFKKETGCNVIHITTDGVFSGKRGSYVESDEHDYIDDYGKSKSLGENPTITNIRTSIIGEEKINKRYLLEWVISNKGETIDGYNNHLWNGVTCLELAKLIDKIIKDDAYWNGIRHVFSPDSVTKYELINMINEVYNLNITVNKKMTNNKCHRNLQTQYIPMIDKSLYDQILELKFYSMNTKN